MDFKILEKEGYKFAFWGSLLAVGAAIVALILTFVLWEVEGISIGATQTFQIMALVLGGIVFPGIIFALNILADQQILKFKLESLIFGIVTVVLSVFVIIIAAISIDYLGNFIIDADPDPAAPVGILVCFYLGIVTMIISAYGGIQSIMYYYKQE